MNKLSTSILSTLICGALAIPTPQASAPDNTVVKQTAKFHLRGENIGVNQALFDNTTYLTTYHVSAGDGGTFAALGAKDQNTPAWYLKGTELFLEEGGAQLQFQPSSQPYPFSVVIDTNDVDANGFTQYAVNAGDNGSPNFGNYTIYGGKGDDAGLFVGHMEVSQNPPTYGCKGTSPLTDEAIVIKLGNRHVDPVTPEGCSEIRFKVELA